MSLVTVFPPPSQIILKTEDDEEKSVASVSAVLFFVLALQTGLTGMEGEKRFQQVLTNRDVLYSYLISNFQICKNLCLLLTAVLHFIHSMVQPVLMSLSASRSSNRASHIRVYISSSIQAHHSKDLNVVEATRKMRSSSKDPTSAEFQTVSSIITQISTIQSNIKYFLKGPDHLFVPARLALHLGLHPLEQLLSGNLAPRCHCLLC